MGVADRRTDAVAGHPARQVAGAPDDAETDPGRDVGGTAVLRQTSAEPGRDDSPERRDPLLVLAGLEAEQLHLDESAGVEGQLP
jgi:hypothetical protein